MGFIGESALNPGIWYMFSFLHHFLKHIPYLSNLDPTNISKEFATGYLLGELLNKHGLQDDFLFFSQNT